MTLRKVPDVTLTASQQTVDVSKVEAEPCAFKLQNESIYTLDIGIGPDTHSLAAWMADVFPTPGLSQFQVTPRSLIGAVNPPSSILLVTTAGAGDVIPGTYPCPLVRQVSAYQTQVSLGTVSSGQGTVAVTLPPGTHTVMVLSNDPVGTVGVIAVKGHTTGFNYKIWGSGGSEGYAFGDLFPVDSADDAVIDVTVTVFSGPGVASARLVALLDPAGVFVNNPLGLPAYTALVLSNSPPATARNGFTTHLNSLSVVLATDQTAVPADVSDRSARLLGAVSAATASTWDVSDRAARLLGTLSVRTGTYTSTDVNVPATNATYFTLAASNAARRGLIVALDGVTGGDLTLIRPGAAAGAGTGFLRMSAANYPNGVYTFPEPIPTGLIQAFTSAVGQGGVVHVTEIA